MKRPIFACIIIALLPQLVLAADGGAFLRIGVGARALGMGGAFVALVDDPTAIYWNPAGLVFLEAGELSSMYTNQFGLGAHFSFLAYGQPVGKHGAWAAGLINLTLGDIPLTGLDERGRPVVIGYTGTTETALLIAYAQMLFRTPLGATVKVIHQSLVGTSGWGLGLDIGSNFAFLSNVSLGMVLRTGFVDWATGERSMFPAQVVFGMAYRPFPQLALAADVGLRTGQRLELHAGIEYFIIPQLALRLGLDRTSPTLGLGVRVARLKLDYAIALHALGLSHRLSFGMRF